MYKSITKSFILAILALLGSVIYYYLVFDSSFLIDVIKIESANFSYKIDWNVALPQALVLFAGCFISFVLLLNSYILGCLANKYFHFDFGRSGKLATGIILYSVYIFIMGSFLKILNTFPFIVISLFPLIAGIFINRLRIELKDLFALLKKEIKNHWRPYLSILGVCIIPLFFSSTYPIDYDVLEYHLGAPKEFFRNGSITFLPHNVYANMPSLSSMFNLVLIAFRLGDGAKILQTVFIIIIACLLYKDSKHMIYGIMGALYLLLSPEIILGSYSARNEPMIMFFVFIALRIIILNGGKDCSLFTGIMAGGAFCLKYSSSVIFFPILIIFLLFEKGNKTGKMIRFFSGVFIVSFPWLLRNFIASNNPFYPFGMSFFEIFFTLKHHPAELFNSVHWSDSFKIQELWMSLKSTFQGFESENVWIVFLLFSPFIKKRKVIYSLTAIILSLLLWLLCTHRLERFLVPLFPLKSMILIFLLSYSSGWVRSFIFLGWCLQMTFNILLILYQFFHTPVFPLHSGKITREVFISRYDTSYAFINNTLKPDEHSGKILFIGEARTYYYDHMIVYNTPYIKPVFLKYIKADKIDKSLLLKDDIEYILINISELDRVRKKYPDNLKKTNGEIKDLFIKDCKLIKKSSDGLKILLKVF